MRLFVIAAGVLGFVGVAAYASAAHGGGGSAMSAAQTHALSVAANMLTIHALALLALAALSEKMPTTTRLAGAAFLIGAIAFATALGYYAFTSHRLLPFLAPAGGTLMMVGWAILAICGALGLLRNR